MPVRLSRLWFAGMARPSAAAGTVLQVSHLGPSDRGVVASTSARDV